MNERNKDLESKEDEKVICANAILEVLLHRVLEDHEKLQLL